MTLEFVIFAAMGDSVLISLQMFLHVSSTVGYFCLALQMLSAPYRAESSLSCQLHILWNMRCKGLTALYADAVLHDARRCTCNSIFGAAKVGEMAQFGLTHVTAHIAWREACHSAPRSLSNAYQATCIVTHLHLCRLACSMSGFR